MKEGRHANHRNPSPAYSLGASESFSRSPALREQTVVINGPWTQGFYLTWISAPSATKCSSLLFYYRIKIVNVQIQHLSENNSSHRKRKRVKGGGTVCDSHREDQLFKSLSLRCTGFKDLHSCDVKKAKWGRNGRTRGGDGGCSPPHCFSTLLASLIPETQALKRLRRAFFVGLVSSGLWPSVGQVGAWISV